ALFDAVYDAVSTLEAWQPPGKKAVVALTDGIDNKSRRRVEEVIDHAKQARIPLYLLGFGRKGELDEKIMETMANQTGGKYFYAENEQKLIDLFESLGGIINDDGIDEESLKELAVKTGGQYYPAKNVSDLKLILTRVTQNIQRKD